MAFSDAYFDKIVNYFTLWLGPENYNAGFNNFVWSIFGENQKNSRCNQFELFMRFLLFSNFWPEKSQNKNGREYEKDSNQGFY